MLAPGTKPENLMGGGQTTTKPQYLNI